MSDQVQVYNLKRNHIDRDEDYVLKSDYDAKVKELAQVIKIGVEGQREVNRQLTVEINNAKDAIRPLYDIPIQDFDYFEKPTHVLHSWTGKYGSHAITVQHVINARKVINGKV